SEFGGAPVQRLADRLEVGVARYVDDAQDLLRATFLEPLGGDDADVQRVLANEAEGPRVLPRGAAGLVHIDRDAGFDGLLDQRIDHGRNEAADDDGIGRLRDGGLHGAGRRGFDVVLVDRDVVELDV